MIGNDIVDLNIASIESNWNRLGFLDKVFSKEEQLFILNAENHSEMVWLLWSMKESAYKIYIQEFGNRFFNPKKLNCHLISKHEGLVYIDANCYLTKSEITNNFVNTIATSNNIKKIINHNFKLENPSHNFQSFFIKEKLLKVFSELKEVCIDNLEIKKSKNGNPILFHNNLEQNYSFSITHHGFYGAYAISI